MSDLQPIADRVEIDALRGEFTDAVMMRDYDAHRPRLDERRVSGLVCFAGPC